MLEELKVKNLALSSQACLELQQGMTTITGETGAGKSLLVDALSLIMGQKANLNMIKDGEDKLEVEAIFSSQNPQVLSYLADHELQSEDNSIIMRRIISRDGKGKALINGHQVTQTALKELSSKLIAIHGQHASIKLLDSNNQLKLLDSFAALDQEAALLAQSYNSYIKERNLLQELADRQKSEAQEFKSWRHYKEELDKLNLGPGGYEELEQEFDRAMHQNKIYDALALAYAALSSDEGNVVQLLNTRLNELIAVQVFDSDIKQASDQLTESITSLCATKDILEELINKQNQIDHLDLEMRMSKCHELARALHCAPQDLYLKNEGLQAKINSFLELKDSIANKTQNVKELRQKYEEQAQALSAKRKVAAKAMGKSISSQIKSLAMENGRFEIELNYNEEIRPRAQGRDEIVFLFTANQGTDLKPLSEVASGGELSRLALSIEAQTSKNQATETIIFDEVDSGISGITASAVGKLLYELAQDVQVLTVTHLPQVAAYSQQQYLVSKSSDEISTNSTLELLDQEGRIKEIARMMGGKVQTKATYESACDLLNKAQHGN